MNELDLGDVRARGRAAGRGVLPAFPRGADRGTRTRPSRPARGRRTSVAGPMPGVSASSPERTRGARSSVSSAIERARRAGVCPRLEFLLAFYFEERADLGQNVRGGTGIHPPNIGGWLSVYRWQRVPDFSYLLRSRRGRAASSRSLRSASESARAPGWRLPSRAFHAALSPRRGSCT